MNFDEPMNYPNLLSDVPDPCTERYYPEWSSRGMRAVRCTRPAKATLVEPDGTHRRVCGVHRRVYLYLSRWRIEK